MLEEWQVTNFEASDNDKMPADLFKKAPEAFRKRAWILINIIELLEARVVLLCKDHGNPTLLANYRPISLCNSFYQLVNIIITTGWLRSLSSLILVFSNYYLA